MTRLIDDLLDISRLSRGKLELRLEQVDLGFVIQRSVEISRPFVEQRGHKLTVDLPPGPMPLSADAARLAQVFSNLLNNAAKFTDRGGQISLRSERHMSKVVVIVADSGSGIASDMLPKIFDLFLQVERTRHCSEAGLGIGLALVKKLVEMHQGSVTARSDVPDRGSEFIVELPVCETESSMVSPSLCSEPVRSVSSLRILVVDDNRDAADCLDRMLRMLGHQTIVAYDGISALSAAEEFHADVVLLDIGLPGLSGCQVAQKIREQPWGGQMSLVALTGWGGEEDMQRALRAGFNHHIVKPVKVSVLTALLDGISDSQIAKDDRQKARTAIAQISLHGPSTGDV